MAKTYAIADLHGRFDLLVRAIELIDEDAGDEPHQVIVMGDFVDRGPEAANIIDALIVCQKQRGWIVLQGNHEVMMFEVLAEPNNRNLSWWFGNGGVATLASYGYNHGDDLQPYPERLVRHLGWLRSLPVWVGDKHRLYVHAGVPFDRPIGECKNETLQWMLYRDKETSQYRHADLHEDAGHVSGKHIVHGHHQSRHHPLCLPHRTNLDSFAWATGHLAIGVFDDETPGGPVKILSAIGLPMEKVA